MYRRTMTALSTLAGLGLLADPVWAQARMDDWGWGMHPMWGWWGIWGFGMALLMFLFWALVIVGIVLGIRWLLRQGRPEVSDSAMEILRERYARGEINREEFEAKKKDLLTNGI